MSNKNAYLDTSFLACIFIPNHEFQKGALRVLAQLMSEEYNLYISPLCLDELWETVRKDRASRGEIKKGITDIAIDAKRIWQLIKQAPNIHTIQIKNSINKAVLKTIEFMEYNNSRPRDSFHMATAASHNISTIVVKDKKFCQILDPEVNPCGEFTLIQI